MSKHSEAFKSLLTLQHYCNERHCDDCCFRIGSDHDNTGYCAFGVDGLAWDYYEEISKRVYFLEQLEMEMAEK